MKLNLNELSGAYKMTNQTSSKAKFTSDEYLAVAVAFYNRSPKGVSGLSKMDFELTNAYFGVKGAPSFLWKWQRDNRISTGVYAIPNVPVVDLADNDIETNDVEFESNIRTQLYKTLDTEGNYQVVFLNNDRVNVDVDVAEKVLSFLDLLKPELRLTVQEAIVESAAKFNSVLALI
jgi:hypothetical protein